MDLQHPTNKMSKSADSQQGTVPILDDASAIAKRIKSAVTDSDNEVRYDREHKPGVSNLLDILAAATDRSVESVAEEFSGTGYGALKGAVADAVVELVTPIQQRYAELVGEPSEVDRILGVGAARAREIAGPVLARARSAAGLLPARTGPSSI
jgi:tryptophanyl-tRNA synthetase